MGLGISIYPSWDSVDKDLEYIETARKLGYNRIFTCFLSKNMSRKELKKLLNNYSKVIEKNKMLLSVDVNPTVFNRLGLDCSDLSFFRDLNVGVLRLDGDFGIDKNLQLFNNGQDIKIELNLSNRLNLEYLEKNNIDFDMILTCHNFYPQRYTGLDLDTLIEYTKDIKQKGIKTAIFISSKSKNAYGPWPVNDGLVTLEACRDMSVDEQARYVESLKLFDDVLFSNAYATVEELRTLAKYHNELTTIKLDFKETSIEQREIILNSKHRYRLDGNNIMIRSSATRNSKVVARKNVKFLKAMDLTLVNDNLKHYEGELEILLQDIEDDGTRNFIGSFDAKEEMILKNIKKDEEFIVEEKK